VVKSATNSRAKTPAVTVVVAAYNMSRTLAYALESIRAQTFRDFETLVIGDASSDDCGLAVKKLRDRRFHWSNLPFNTGGQWGPNNDGNKRARGRYIAYLGQDDLWFPWHLSSLVETIQKSGADFAHSLVFLVGPDGKRLACGLPSKGRSYLSGTFPPSGWLHRRQLAEEIGWWRGHDEISQGTDVDFIRRVCLSGKSLKFSNAASVVKFPSAWWESYKADADVPQTRYFLAMKDDPHKLLNELLFGVAVESAVQLSPVMSIVEAAKAAVGGLQLNLAEMYGRERWPLSSFLKWRFQRMRRRVRRQRGLPPLPGKNN